MVQLTRISGIMALTILLGGCMAARNDLPQPATVFGEKPHFANHGTNKVHYLSIGRGRSTVVFVHGWGGNAEFWSNQIPAFSARTRVLVVDLPGHGRSDKPSVKYTLDYLAGGVLAAMRDAHVNRAVLVGHSMGTAVICRVYEQAPQRVAALVAVDMPLRRPPLPAADRERFIEALRAPDYAQHVSGFVGSMFPKQGTEQLRDRTIAEILKTPQHVMISAMENMFDPGQRDWDLKRVDVPVLAINTDHPRWTADYEAYLRSLSSRNDYRVIRDAGHWVMLEKPDEFNETLAAMLEEFDLLHR